MKYIIIVIASLLVANLACVKRICGCEPIPVLPFKAVVVETSNIDCGRPTIRVENEDAAAVRQITGSNGDTYVVDQLPASLNILDQKLNIAVRKLEPSEDFACTMLGVTYDHIKILQVTERN
jgi:hypothetical protein